MRHAFILAGGLGTRLRPHTLVLPKPLIPLGSEAIIERVLRSLEEAGLTQVTISLGYLGHLVEAVIGDGSRFGMVVSYTRETTPLGTAGALTLIPFDLADDDSLLVINGDTLSSLDFRAFLDWFEGTNADAAMVCVRRDVQIDYGVVQVDAAGRLVAIDEKPTTTNTLSTGINVFRGRVLRRLSYGHTDMPNFLTSLASDGLSVLCRVENIMWMDLGRVEDLAAANELIDSGQL